jgi:hypothetical protein
VSFEQLYFVGRMWEAGPQQALTERLIGFGV